MKAERNHARLYRSSDDVVIAGVCAGVADYLGLPSGKVRLATLLLVLVGGLSIWVYMRRKSPFRPSIQSFAFRCQGEANAMAQT